MNEFLSKGIFDAPQMSGFQLVLLAAGLLGLFLYVTIRSKLLPHPKPHAATGIERNGPSPTFDPELLRKPVPPAEEPASASDDAAETAEETREGTEETTHAATMSK